MNRPTRRSIARPVAAVGAVLAAATVAACSGDGEPITRGASTATATAVASPQDPLLGGLVGPGCAAYAAAEPKGAASVQGMSIDPLATALSDNPLLKTFSSAIWGKMNKKLTMASTLNGGEYTVFAPVDAAFAKLPVATSDSYARDAALLRRMLSYHVVMGQLAPNEVVGRQKTVEGGDLVVTGSGAAMKVDDASVICGGMQTANAKVYLIDKVLDPARN